MADVIRLHPKVFRDLKKLDKNFAYIEKRLGPQVTARSLNRVTKTAQGRVARYVRDNTQLMMRKRGQTRYIGPKGDKAVKLMHVNKRLFVGRATLRRLHSRLKGYAQNMPAIRVGDNRVGGKRLVVMGRATVSKKRSTLGGLRIGRRQYPNAFLNLVTGNKGGGGGKYHMLMRYQKKTWIKGHSGWKDWRRGSSTRNRWRTEYTVLQYDLNTPFQKTNDVVQMVFDERFEKEFNQNFAYYAGRSLATRR